MKKITVYRPPESQREQLKQKAAELGHTVNQLLIMIVRDWLKQQEKTG